MKTSPKHLLDVLFWPLLQLVWEPFSGKKSHFWHWRRYEVGLFYPMLVEGDKQADPRRGSVLALLKQTNFGWRRAVVLEPVDYEGEYQAGFRASESGIDGQRGEYTELCSVVLNGPFAGLVGPDTVQFFAVAYPSGEPLRLGEPKIMPKKDVPDGVVLI